MLINEKINKKIEKVKTKIKMVSNEKNITFDEIWKEIPETELKRQVLIMK